MEGGGGGAQHPVGQIGEDRALADAQVDDHRHAGLDRQPDLAVAQVVSLGAHEDREGQRAALLVLGGVGGSLELESEVGKGTIATARFPAERAIPAVAAG